ncbi:uncharacterized protein [Clytia hemisphaerica]|uniref:Uncharacterized protein n=1 Tax=Clytia hemisphaerica TaxID=252671 RepID=A0A7M5URE7_9CNID
MKTFREQYNFWNFMFQHQPTTDFYYAQCPCIHPLSVVGYRFFCAVYCIFFWTLSLGFSILDHNGYRWFKLYSSWVYMIATFFFSYAFFISFLEVCKVCKFNDSKKQRRKDRYKNQEPVEEIPAEGRFRSNQKLYDDIELDQPSVSSRQPSNEDIATNDGVDIEEPLPWRFQILWFLENLVMVNSITSTIAYWIFIRDSSENLTFNDIRSYFIIDRHGIVTFFLLVEFLLNKIPWRIFHFIYPLAFGISYLIFHLINWYYTRDNIYKFLDWKDHIGHSILYFTGAFVCIIVLQFLLFLVYRKKRQ